jgi:radical SAM superfamily enzyme YgiQ (UPF0313 family)
MKVLLIRPPYTRLKGMGQSPYFPLGIGYIAAVLRKNGIEAQIYHVENPRLKRELIHTEADISYDLRSVGYRKYQDSIKDDTHYVWKEVVDTLREYKPDIVGISLLSVEVASALKISRICKEYDEKCHVVWGGLHPSFLPLDCLKNKEVDFVIRGEGEYPMLDLCHALQKGGDLAEVRNLCFKRDGEIIENPKGELIPNIDAIPLPARDAVLYPDTFDFKSLGSMIISRGCPFRCTFCSSRNFWDRKERFRSPGNVVEEIRTLQSTYGTNFIMFWDDSFTINRKVIQKYCNAIIDSKLKINWKTATRADLIDEDMIRLMKRSGCVKLEIGVESGSDRMKKIIRKDVTNEQIKRAFDLINRNGLGSGAFFMAGFPEETVEDLEQTFALMKELNAAEIAFNIFDPMPGSSEYEKCIQLGLTPENPDWNNFPFWPDAHYMKYVERDQFGKYADMMAKWLYDSNNSLKHKFRRNRHYIYFLLKNDPLYLVEKVYRYTMRRKNVLRLAQ